MKKNNQNIYYMKKEVYQQIVEYCKKEAPLEACGLISGIDKKGLSFWPVPNEENSPFQFKISEKSMKETLSKVERKGEQLTGVFHSHPNTRAYPSYYDIKNHSYPNLAYIIVSLLKKEPTVCCFSINENKQVTNLKLELI
ncbi:Mov34/MPN/PAD-1 family protein [Alkalihalobacillus sp. BA299]|uniref:Mov34/MPN/PAD-1 family protein n=1 Tax=Alkalihalobacillus sp. BA299 TaxID=2815938 RepID=UPI001ADBD876|nr:M67 family metallopeptidase [Alkalihalobacillus sp. BA299]